LIVGSPTARPQPLSILQRLGFQCAEADDPYHAMAELCARPLVYRALILSLNSLYREELQLIPTLKRRFPHLEIWLTGTDGRQAAMAESMRLGADGLLADDGLHRTAIGGPLASPTESTAPLPIPPRPEPPAPPEPDPSFDDDTLGEPVLSAEELRALLQEQPSLPHGERDHEQ
jgi:hypothetical protein